MVIKKVSNSCYDIFFGKEFWHATEHIRLYVRNKKVIRTDGPEVFIKKIDDKIYHVDNTSYARSLIPAFENALNEV